MRGDAHRGGAPVRCADAGPRQLPVFELNDDTVKKLAKRFLEIDGNGNGRIEVKIGGDERARGEIKRLLVSRVCARAK